MKLKNKKSTLFKTLVSLVLLVFLLTYASFSWIKREWSPKIEQENISIATSGALVFQFTDFGDEVTTTKTVNEILGVSDFALKPVSSSSGMVGEFFGLEYADEVGFETFKHLDYKAEGVNSEAALGIRHGYIVMNFKLMLAATDGDTSKRYVYLNPNSHVTPTTEGRDVTSAIRISIYSEQAGIAPIILRTKKPNVANGDSLCWGVTNVKTNDQFVANGERLYDLYSDDPDVESKRNETTDDNVELLKVQNVRTMDEFDCVDDTGLFVIEPLKSINITVCIWLEGEDELCNDQITDDQINLLLQFSAMKVEDHGAANAEA